MVIGFLRLTFPQQKTMQTTPVDMEGTAIGWPLGLGNTNTRIRLVAAADAAAPQPAASHLRRTSSFSSFWSSDLDTESTASFFPDQSVSLGKLIGIKAAVDKGRLRHCENEGHVGDERSDHGVEGVPNSDYTHNCYQRICTPLLHHVIGGLDGVKWSMDKIWQKKRSR